MTFSYLFSPLWCDITCTAVFVETIHMHHHDAAKYIIVWPKGSCIIQTKKWYNDREKINLMNVKKTFITAFCWYQFCKNTMGIGIFFCFLTFHILHLISGLLLGCCLLILVCTISEEFGPASTRSTATSSSSRSSGLSTASPLKLGDSR